MDFWALFRLCYFEWFLILQIMLHKLLNKFVPYVKECYKIKQFREKGEYQRTFWGRGEVCSIVKGIAELFLATG